MNSLLQYHGGKHKIADWIISKMPEHKCYVEPFGGGASVLLKKNPVITEVYNDLDKEVYNVFRVIRDNYDELVRRVSMTLYSREDFYLSFEKTNDPIESARRFLVQSRMSLSTANRQKLTGTFRTTVNADDYHSNPLTLYNVTETIFLARQRLSRVIIENTDAFMMFKSYNLPETLWFLDPPYLKQKITHKSIKHGYSHNLTDHDHEMLCKVIRTLKGKVIICNYDNEIYNEILADWHTDTCRGFTNSSRKTVEKIWMNYKYQDLFTSNINKQ